MTMRAPIEAFVTSIRTQIPASYAKMAVGRDAKLETTLIAHAARLGYQTYSKFLAVRDKIKIEGIDIYDISNDIVLTSNILQQLTDIMQ